MYMLIAGCYSTAYIFVFVCSSISVVACAISATHNAGKNVLTVGTLQWILPIII